MLSSRAFLPTCFVLLLSSSEGLPSKRSVSCPNDSTKIEGPSQYSDVMTCGDIVAAGVDYQDPIYLDECGRIMGGARPYIVPNVAVVHCLPFANGTIRYKTEICCPGILTETRCYTCQDVHLIEDQLTGKYEHDHCNSQDLNTCGDGQVCSFRYDYFAAPGGKTRYQITKGCMSRQECRNAKSNNSLSCVSGIPHPSCTLCCNDPLCNKNPFLKPLEVAIDNSDDPCNEKNGLGNPCLNGGACAVTGTTITCTCIDGYHGDACELDVCDSPSPCQGDSLCSPSQNTPYYSCLCRAGLYGDKCDLEYPECASNSCQNGGTCRVGAGGETCMCAEGFVGDVCEIRTTMRCSSPNLYITLGEETLERYVGNRENSCTAKYRFTEAKSSTETLVGFCRSHLFPSFKDGVHGNLNQLAVEGSEVIKCEVGDGTMQYQVAVCCPSCLGNPCQNGGWCVQDGFEHVCRCRYGYSGDQCQYKTNLCVMFGDPHYFTLDGLHIIYHGSCKHLISSSTNAANVPAFNVNGRSEHRYGNTAVTYPSYIEVTVYGFTIRLGRNGLVVVNGDSIENFVGLKTYANGRITVQRNGGFIRVDTDFGLRVQFDGSLVAEVWLPETLTDHTSGICGNNNGNPSDDLTTKNGEDLFGDPARYSKVGNSWQVHDPEDPECKVVVQDDPKECDNDEYKNKEHCGLILDPSLVSPFDNCLTHNGGFINIFGMACRYDVCINNGEKDAACGALSALASACADRGFIVNWRTPDFCPMECDSDREYQFSGSACPTTCTRPKAEELCSLRNTETCACPGNKVLKDDHCVDPYDCGCIDELGQNQEVGQTWMSADCKTKFTCEFCDDCHDSFGKIVQEVYECPPEKACHNGTCDDATTTTSTTTTSTTTTPPTTTTTPTTTPPPTTTTTPPPTTTTTPPPTTTANAPPPPPPHPVSGTCRCYGDPHCTTIDGFHFNLSMASCGMTLLRDGCNGGIPSGSKNSYEVAVDIDSSGRRWFIEGVRVVTGGHTLEMGSTPLVVVVDGASVSQHSIKGSTEGSPVVIHGFKLYQTAPRRVMVVLSNGVHIEWNFNRRVKAQIPATQASHTCGICGNSDGNPNNDHVLGSDSRCPAKSQLPQTHQAGDLIGTSEADSLLYALSWYSYTRSGDTACSNSCQ